MKELSPNLLYAGIFDGHSSSMAADYVWANLETHMEYWLTQTSNLSTVLTNAFIELNNLLARHLTYYFLGQTSHLLLSMSDTSLTNF